MVSQPLHKFTEEHDRVNWAVLALFCSGIVLILLKLFFALIDGRRTARVFVSNETVNDQVEEQVSSQPAAETQHGAKSQRPYQDFRKVYGSAYKFEEPQRLRPPRKPTALDESELNQSASHIELS